MDDDTNPANHHDGTDHNNKDAQNERVIQGIDGIENNGESRESKQAPHHHKKPSAPVRVLRVLWRRRTWRRMADREGGVNWAEKTTIFITAAIFIVGVIQAYIYQQQAKIMQASLEQNERSVILNRGQLAVSSRNTETAEKQFEGQQAQIRAALDIDLSANYLHDMVETSCVITNRGQSLATDVNVEWEIIPAQKFLFGQGDLRRYIWPAPKKYAPKPRQDGLTIFPGTPRKECLQAFPMMGEDLEMRHFAIIFHVSWRDIWKKPWTTERCLIYQTSKQFEPCVFANSGVPLGRP